MRSIKVLAGLLGLAWSGAASAAEAQWGATPGRLQFEVFRDGDKPFGQHLVEVTADGEGLRVKDTTNYQVKVGPFVFYRYERACEERWLSGALQSFTCSTNDNGRTIKVSGEASEAGLTVRSPKGVVTYPQGAQHFAPWNLAYAEAPALIDSETGQPFEGGVRPLKAEEPGVRPMRVEGSIKGVFRYDELGRWVGLSFKAAGQRIDYVLRSPIAEAPH